MAKKKHLHLHIKYYEEVEFDNHFASYRRVTKYRCDCGEEHVFKAKEEDQISMPHIARIEEA